MTSQMMVLSCLRQSQWEKGIQVRLYLLHFFFLHCSVKSRCNFLNCVAQHVQTAQQLLADSAVYLLQQVLVERVRQCLLISLT